MSVICMAQLSPVFCINSDEGRLDLFHFLLLLCIGVHGWEERRKTERSKAEQQSNGSSSSLSTIIAQGYYLPPGSYKWDQFEAYGHQLSKWQWCQT